MNQAQLDIIAAKIDADETLADLVTAQDYPAIADALNAPTVIDNPNPQGVIAAPVTLAGILGVLTKEEKRAILSSSGKAFGELSVIYETADSPELDRGMGWLATNEYLDGQSIAEVAGLLVDADERALLADLVTALVQTGRLSTGTAAQLAAAMQATMPDPTWTATVPGPSWAASQGLPTVRPSDVQAVLA